ncbi:hypothetical protein BIY27_05405 [Gibbsiella quercinecans]|nr:hypothetical protein BIY27_05405 [Gibbsiella quercinecans]
MKMPHCLIRLLLPYPRRFGKACRGSKWNSASRAKPRAGGRLQRRRGKNGGRQFFYNIKPDQYAVFF